MELIQKELNIERIVLSENAQVQVAGDVPVLEGRSARSIIDASASVAVQNAELIGDSLKIVGTVKIDAVCADGQNEYFSFTSSAPLMHTMPYRELTPTSRINVRPTVQSFIIRPGDSVLSFDATIELVCTATDSAPIHVLSAICGIDDMECKCQKLKLASRTHIGTGRLRLREELEAKGINAIMASNGYAICDSVICSADGAQVKGRIVVSALASDKDSRLSQLTEEIGFDELIPVQTFTHSPMATAELESISMRPLSDEFGLVSVEAIILIDIEENSEKECELPIDAYSPTVSFDPKLTKLDLPLPCEMISARRTIKERIALVEGLPSLSRPVYASAKPLVTMSYADGNDLTIEGVLLTRIVYESESGSVYSFIEDIPFVATVECSKFPCEPVAAVNCCAKITNSGERWVEVVFTIDMLTKLNCDVEIETIVGFEECPDTVCEQKGILIYAARPGDTVFDIAKHLRVPQSLVKESCPSKDSFEGSEKIVVFKA